MPVWPRLSCSENRNHGSDSDPYNSEEDVLPVTSLLRRGSAFGPSIWDSSVRSIRRWKRKRIKKGE